MECIEYSAVLSSCFESNMFANNRDRDVYLILSCAIFIMSCYCFRDPNILLKGTIRSQSEHVLYSYISTL